MGFNHMQYATFAPFPESSNHRLTIRDTSATEGRHPEHGSLVRFQTPSTRRHPHALPPNLLPRSLNSSNHNSYLPLFNPQPRTLRNPSKQPSPRPYFPKSDSPPQICRPTPLRARLLAHPPHRSRLLNIPLHTSVWAADSGRREWRMGMGEAEGWICDCESG